MTERGFFEALAVEYGRPFSGWDFSHVNERMVSDPLPWNYRLVVMDAVSASESLLDMGTGGGEFLDSLPALPPVTFATEGYAPNVPVAKARLSGKSVQVVEIAADDALPFDDRSFDLVINRHASFAAGEVARILRTSGRFITQQVGGMNGLDINASLGAPPADHFGWCLLEAKENLLHAGFRISTCREYIGKTRFYDVYSLVYYLKCIPWQIAGFSIEAYFRRLCLLNEEMREKGYKDFILHRFLVAAEK